MDRTMIVWTPDEASGVWVDSARVGEVGGTYIQGFFGGLFGPGGRQIVSHGFHGAFYCWEAAAELEGSPADGTAAAGDGADEATPTTAASTSADVASLPTRWVQKAVPTGHFAAVRDMAWDPSGSGLASVSDDQTTRLFMPCKSSREALGGSADAVAGACATESWNELSRPQVHGYDMRCVTFTSSHELVTGADEKVIRVFEAPDTYFNAVKCLLDAHPQTVDAICNTGVVRPLGASIPALGLSNKAVFSAETADDQHPDEARAKSSFALDGVVLPFAQRDLSAPPLEEDLVQNTLWSVANSLRTSCD
jgi:elongator complex protein 2